MTNGEIVIRPTVLSDDRFVKDGSLMLKGYDYYRHIKISKYIAPVTKHRPIFIIIFFCISGVQMMMIFLYTALRTRRLLTYYLL